MSDFDAASQRSSFEGFGFDQNSSQNLGIFTSGSWMQDEDYDLCYIWCHFFKDPIQGSDQSGDTFWGKVTNSYNKKHPDRKRSLASIKGRFGKINRQTQCFDSQVFKLKQTNPSGMGSELDMVRFLN